MFFNQLHNMVLIGVVLLKYIKLAETTETKNTRLKMSVVFDLGQIGVTSSI